MKLPPKSKPVRHNKAAMDYKTPTTNFAYNTVTGMLSTYLYLPAITSDMAKLIIKLLI